MFNLSISAIILILISTTAKVIKVVINNYNFATFI